MLSKFQFKLKNNILQLLLTITLFICVITLIGWVFNIQILQNFSSGNFWIKMLPISAIAMILSSLAIYLKEINKFKKTAVSIVCILLFLGITTIINSITKTDILQLRVLGISIDSKIIIHISSIEFVLLNFSILLLFSSKKSLHLISEILASITFFIAAIFFIGYTYGIGKMQIINGFSSIAIQTAICLLLLSFLVLRLSHQKKIIGVFLEPANISRVSRRYLFLIFFLIFFLDWVRLWGEKLGYYSTEVGLGIMMLIFIITCFIIIRYGVIVIKQKEQEKLLSELNLKTILDRINVGFISLDYNWCYRYVNNFAAEVLNSNPTELIGKNMLEEYPEVKGHIFHTCCIQALNSKKHVHFESYYPPFKKWFEYNIYPTENELSIFYSDTTERKEITESMLVFNERFNLISKATSEALWENNLITGELWANEMHQNLYGLTLNDPIPTEEEWIRRIHPDDRESILSTHDLNLRSKEKTFTSEYRFLLNNEYINIYDRVYFVRDENDNPIRIMGNMMDITHLKKIEEKLENSKAHLQTILDTAPQCIKILNKNGELLEMNKKGLEILGVNKLEEIINKPIIDIIDEPYKDDYLKIIKSVFGGESVLHQFEINSYNGKKNWLESYSVPLKDKAGNIVALLSVTNDISSRKKVEIELQESYNSVRKLTKHLQNIREEERTFLSRELHDELGQQLAAMKMDLGWVNKKLKEAEEPVREKTNAVMEQISLLIRSVRKISFDLRPSTLSDFGIAAAMEQYLKDFEERSEIKISFNSPTLNPELNDTVKTALFRIFQESITNISRHAQAQNIFIELNFFDEKIILVIQDDGIGFNEEILKTNKTLGIIGMKERVVILDGEFEIVSEPNKGTTIKVEIPYLEN